MEELEITKTWGISGVDGVPEDMIYLARVCPITNTINEMMLPITEEEYLHGMDDWAAGELIQNAFPMLNEDQREFVKTGILPETWDCKRHADFISLLEEVAQHDA